MHLLLSIHSYQNCFQNTIWVYKIHNLICTHIVTQLNKIFTCAFIYGTTYHIKMLLPPSWLPGSPTWYVLPEWPLTILKAPYSREQEGRDLEGSGVIPPVMQQRRADEIFPCSLKQASSWEVSRKVLRGLVHLRRDESSNYRGPGGVGIRKFHLSP